MNEQLTDALEHRTAIGIAIGILMERFQVDDAQAMEYLKRLSSHQNRKLHDIAAEIADTRRVPR
jgi:AmiR/NasT family two-component response regulator